MIVKVQSALREQLRVMVVALIRSHKEAAEEEDKIISVNFILSINKKCRLLHLHSLSRCSSMKEHLMLRVRVSHLI